MNVVCSTGREYVSGMFNCDLTAIELDKLGHVYEEKRIGIICAEPNADTLKSNIEKVIEEK